MKNRKVIAFVIPSLHAGGMERVMSELANYASTKNSLKCVLVSLGNSEDFYILNDKVEHIKPKYRFNPKRKVIGSLKLLLFLRKELRKIKPDSVLSFGETYNSFVLLATLGLGLNVFVSDRSKPNKDWGFFHNKLRQFIYRFAKGIISQTCYSKQFLLKETGHKNIIVIPNPIKMFNFNYIEKKNVVLTVGRLIASKQINVLIDVFSRLNKKDWELWIVGDGPERVSLETQVNTLGLEDIITFWGSRFDINSFYSQSSIFAFTSNSEGFPNAILEAMSMGLPVIAYDCVAGPSDMIDNNNNGFLIKLGDEDEYLLKLKELIENKDKRNSFGYNAKESSKRYNIEIVGETYIDFLLS